MSTGHRRSLLILGAFGILLLGVAAGNWLARADGKASTPAPREATVQRSPGPVPTEGSAGPAGRTRTGAVAAAAEYVRILDRPAFLDPTSRHRLVREIAAARSAEQLLSDLDRVATTVTEQLGLSASDVAEPSFVWRAVPAGWRMRRYDGDEATVAVWATGVFIAQGRQLDQPGWHTVEVSLRWERGAWRLTSLHNEPGPRPPLAGVDGADVGVEINAFHPFAHVAADGEGMR